MKIEMREGEREILQAMLGGGITASCARLYHKVREKLLLAGHNYDMPKEHLAIIAVLADSVTNYNGELTQPLEPIELSGATDPTPDDEITNSDKDAMEAESKGFNPEVTGGAYKGNRIKWETVFESTPNTPIQKLEKGRPISFIDPKDNQRYFGKFVKIAPKDKRMANVLPNGKKVPFPVPVKNIDVVDLSPPSPEPLAVQI